MVTKGDIFYECSVYTEEEENEENYGKTSIEVSTWQVTSVYKRKSKFLGKTTIREGLQIFFCEKNQWTTVKGKLEPAKAADFQKKRHVTFRDMSAAELTKEIQSYKGLFKSKSAAIRNCLAKEKKSYKNDKRMQLGERWCWWESEEEKKQHLNYREKEIRLLKSRLSKEMKQKKKKVKK